MKNETQPRIEIPVEFLTCCCCGNSVWGRQWWNHDTGYGLCARCHKINGITEDTKYSDCFGHRGVHWGLPDQDRDHPVFSTPTLQPTEATGN